MIKKQLGFAFVQFENKADADKAIEDFNGKEFKGRKIYVKKAVPPPTPEEKQKKIEEFRAKKAEEKAKKVEESKKAGESAVKPANGNAKPQKTKKKTKKADKPANEDETAEDASSKIPEGKPSSDTVFITNLDYNVNVKTLNGIFKDLKPKWIHVPTRRVPLHVLKRQRSKGRTIFNKGIAFVKFSDEETQKKAIAEFNGKDINGRNIIVDIAIDARIPKSDEKDGENGEENENVSADGIVDQDDVQKDANDLKDEKADGNGDQKNDD